MQELHLGSVHPFTEREFHEMVRGEPARIVTVDEFNVNESVRCVLNW